MKQPISRFMHLYFDAALDLRVRIFNVMVLISSCFCLIIADINGATGKGVTAVLVDLSAALFCAVLLVRAKMPGHAAACRLICFFLNDGASFASGGSVWYGVWERQGLTATVYWTGRDTATYTISDDLRTLTDNETGEQYETSRW